MDVLSTEEQQLWKTFDYLQVRMNAPECQDYVPFLKARADLIMQAICNLKTTQPLAKKTPELRQDTYTTREHLDFERWNETLHVGMNVEWLHSIHAHAVYTILEIEPTRILVQNSNTTSCRRWFNRRIDEIAPFK